MRNLAVVVIYSGEIFLLDNFNVGELLVQHQMDELEQKKS